MYSEGVLYYYVRGIYRYWPLNRVDRIVTVSSNEIDSICNCTIYTMVFVEHLYSEISTLIWTVYTLCLHYGRRNDRVYLYSLSIAYYTE